MDAKQLAKLVRQNAAKAEKLAKARQSRRYDKTLPPPQDNEEDVEREHFFKEMKKREWTCGMEESSGLDQVRPPSVEKL